MERDHRRRGSGLRMLMWIGAACLLLLPAVAMQFTTDVAWTARDFMTWGTMLFVACGTYELAFRMSGNTAYRAAVGIAVLGAFLTVWFNLAVGIIGDEHNPANLMFGGVLAVGIVGGLLARFQPEGMMRALLGTAIAQAVVGIVALFIPQAQGEVWILTAFFIVLWLLSAALFRRAVRAQ
jgi:hypothetical protein